MGGRVLRNGCAPEGAMPIPALEMGRETLAWAPNGKKNGTVVPTLWTERFAQRTHRMTSSAIRELLKLTARPDVISFAGGLPAPELFPIEEFRAAADAVLSKQGRQALQYSTTEGYPPLREMIVRHMARYGIIVDTENVLMTTGSQEALDLVGKVLINPGDRILTEEPTYLGAIQAFTMYGADYV